jgi:23S rRNA pseudouridine2605 synthase
VRLNKALSQAGICSRRRADELVLAGKVELNGVLVREPGQKIDPKCDIVVVDGQKVRFSPQKNHIYLLFHKPVQTVTTASDPQGRPTVFDLLPPDIPRQGLFSVGRLDYFSEGLLLFTDDGELTHKLTHPSTHVPKIYHVLVRGQVTGETLAVMRRGMRLAEGELLAPVEAEVISRPLPDRALVSMRLIQGVNRQIRRMCRDLNLTILRLVRVAQGSVRLGDLPVGKARFLTPDEVAGLRSASGLGAAPPAPTIQAAAPRRGHAPGHPAKNRATPTRGARKPAPKAASAAPSADTSSQKKS